MLAIYSFFSLRKNEYDCGMAKSRPILQYDLEGNFVQYHESARAAALSVGLKSHSGIIACCQLKENVRQVSGFQWLYGDTGHVPEKIEAVRARGNFLNRDTARAAMGMHPFGKNICKPL
jgi:hypothetical protein